MKQTCTSCKKLKAIKAFYADNRRPNGLQSHCKDCFRSQHKEYRKSNRYQKWKKGYYSRTDVKNHLNQKMSKWRKSEKGKKYLKEYRQRTYFKEKYNAYYREYRKRPIPHFKDTLLFARYRTAKISSSDNTVTAVAMKELMLKQDNRCAICGTSFSKRKPHLDHIIPISKGGKHTLSNVQWLCYICNIRKSNH